MDREVILSSSYGNVGDIAEIAKSFNGGVTVREYAVPRGMKSKDIPVLKEPYYVPKKRLNDLYERFYQEMLVYNKLVAPKVDEMKKKVLNTNYDFKKIKDKIIGASLFVVGGVLISLSSLINVGLDLLLYIGIYITSFSGFYLIDEVKNYVLAKNDKKNREFIKLYESNVLKYSEFVAKREARERSLCNRTKVPVVPSSVRDGVINKSKSRILSA